MRSDNGFDFFTDMKISDSVIRDLIRMMKTMPFMAAIALLMPIIKIEVMEQRPIKQSLLVDMQTQEAFDRKAFPRDAATMRVGRNMAMLDLTPHALDFIGTAQRI